MSFQDQPHATALPKMLKKCVACENRGREMLLVRTRTPSYKIT